LCIWGSLQFPTLNSQLTVFPWPYPKAIINPIIAPRPVLMYGLQVKPQVLPIFMEIRLRANPMTAPITGPRITFNAMADFPFYNTFLTIFSS
jgi:hypothetical protein